MSCSEAALIDAVLSIRNRYGKNPTTSGVRGVVQRYRDDLSGEIRRRPLPRSSHSCGWTSPSSSSDHPDPSFFLTRSRVCVMIGA